MIPEETVPAETEEFTYPELPEETVEETPTTDADLVTEMTTPDVEEDEGDSYDFDDIAPAETAGKEPEDQEDESEASSADDMTFEDLTQEPALEEQMPEEPAPVAEAVAEEPAAEPAGQDETLASLQADLETPDAVTEIPAGANQTSDVYSVDDLEKIDAAPEYPEGVEAIAEALEPAAEPKTQVEEPATEPETQIEEPAAEPEPQVEEPAAEPEPQVEEPAAEPEPQVEEPAAEPEPQVETAIEAAAPFVFAQNDGFKSFTAGETGSVIALKTDKLSHWSLVVNEISVSPVQAEAGQEIPLSDQMYCQGAFIGEDGTLAPFANAASVAMPPFTGEGVQNATMVLSGLSVMPLAGQDGQTVDLGGANGILTSIDGDTLFFAGATMLDLSEAFDKPAEPAVEKTEQTAEPVETPAGTTKEKQILIPAYCFADVQPPVENAFVFSPVSPDAEIDGETQTPHILVKAQTPLYGWTVAFENGTNMSLEDVRTYQQINGKLPDAAGVLSFNGKTLRFKNIVDIKIFDVPAYCGYGILPTA